MALWKNDDEMFALMKEKLYTPVVGDILDQMGYKHQFLPANIRPLAAQVPTAPYILPGETEDKRLKLAGYACTVLENDVFEEPAKPFGYMTEALDDLKPNEIYIATGAHNSALWGELLTACGKARGAVGAVLDGYTRDTPKVIEQNFSVFCTGTWAQDSSVRTYVFQWRCPIEIGQVTIHNGDIVFDDIDGVLIIPKEIAPEVLEKALIKASTEKTMRKAIEDGMMVTDALRAILLDQPRAPAGVKQNVAFLVGAGGGKLPAPVKTACLGAVKGLCQCQRAGGGAQPLTARLHIHVVGQHP